MNEKVEFALINSEEIIIPQNENRHDETNSSDSSEKLELKNEEENEAQNEDQDEEPNEYNNKKKPDDGENNDKPNDKPDDGDDEDDEGDEDDEDDKDDVDDKATQLEAMRSYVPFVGILGWSAYLQALGEDFKNEEARCDKFRIYIQWIYLSICFIIAFVYYMRQSKLINEDLLYRKRLGIKTGVRKWRWVISHFIVTVLYLLTIDEQPFACHLPYPQGEKSKEEKKIWPSYEEQLSYLRYSQLAVVFLTTATLKAFHAISSGLEPEKEHGDDDDDDAEKQKKAINICCK